jgi:uncharacterized protein (TIGR03382 family)
MKNTLLSLVALVCLLGVWGCMDNRPTGALEPEELYNTSGILEGSLFDDEGLAPVTYAEQAFMRVGFMWDAEESCLLEGRLMDLSGRWSAWKPLSARWSEGVARTGHLDASGWAVGFQLRVSAGPEPTHLVAEAIEALGEPFAPPADDQDFSNIQQALAPSGLVNSRSSWGARSPACNSSSHSPAKVTVHHTATPLPDSVSPEARLRQIQNYHIDTRGWCDIGYHFLVDWNGEMWQGRNETVRGAHVANNNTNNVGISFMGTYSSTPASGTQLDACAGLLDWLHDNYGVPLNRSYILGHRQYGGTSCPGDRLYGQLDDLVARANGNPGQDPGGDPGQDPSNGTMLGVVFEDQGVGTANMTKRLPGATIQVSGGGSITARAGDAYWSLDLPPGTYTVTATIDGYQSASRTCSVIAGSETWCSVGLVPGGGSGGGTGALVGVVYVDQGQGSANMSLRLPGATVTIAGVSSTTARHDDGYWYVGLLAAGTYTVEASADGYLSASRTCSVQADAETWCSVGLVPDDPGGDPGGDPGQDPGDPTGLLYGYVVELADPLDQDLSDNPPVGNAEVRSSCGAITTSDSSGYFELEVEPGTRVLTAYATGYDHASAVCTVSEGGATECFVPVVPLPGDDPGNPGDPGDPGGDSEDGEDAEFTGGCSTAGSTPGPAPLLLLGLLLLRRRRIR